MERVSKVISGKDDVVRIKEVQTAGGTVSRTVYSCVHCLWRIISQNKIKKYYQGLFENEL